MAKKKATIRKNTKKNISSDVLNKIKKQHIEPKPKWGFLLKSWVMWTLCITTLILGALSIGITFFLLRTNDWDIREELNQGLIGFTIETLPYIWVALFTFFAFLAYYNFRHTNKGYKVSFHKLTVIGVALSIAIGGGIYATGMAEDVEGKILRHIPRYEKLHSQRHQQMWNSPDRGLLSGKIIKVKNTNNITLEDIDYKEWEVELIDYHERKSNLLEEGKRIKLKGKITGENTFTGKDFRPWGRNFMEHTNGINMPPHERMMENGEGSKSPRSL